MQVVPITDSFVADIVDVNAALISDDDFDKLYNAWLEFGVLRLRNQPLSEAELQVV